MDINLAPIALKGYVLSLGSYVLYAAIKIATKSDGIIDIFSPFVVVLFGYLGIISITWCITPRRWWKF